MIKILMRKSSVVSQPSVWDMLMHATTEEASQQGLAKAANAIQFSCTQSSLLVLRVLMEKLKNVWNFRGTAKSARRSPLTFT